MKPIKIAIAEDHQLVRQGIISLLTDEDDLEVVIEAENGAILLDQLKLEKTDIVLLDLEMPVLNGQDALKFITDRYPDIRVIIVSMFYADEFISECIMAGARGFLPKNCDIEKVIEAIHAVNQQGYYFDDKISHSLLSKLTIEKNIAPTFSKEELSQREIEIIQLVCDGLTNKIIAKQLCISVRTVEGHRSAISEKTNAKNIAGLVIYAIKNGIYSI